jgi:hypothetical protein
MRIAPIAAIDVSMSTKPLRTLRIDERLPTVVVESVCRQPRFVERIDLLSPGADARLAKYRIAI